MMAEFMDYINASPKRQKLWEQYLTLSLHNIKARQIEMKLNEGFKKWKSEKRAVSKEVVK